MYRHAAIEGGFQLPSQRQRRVLVGSALSPFVGVVGLQYRWRLGRWVGMKASFTKAEDGRVGFCFEPENFQDQILLEQFTPDSERFDEFRFSVWTTATLGSTSFWGRIVTAVESSSVTVNVDAEDTAAPKTTLEIVDRPSSGVGSPVHRSLIRLDSLPAVNLRAAVLDDRTVELVRAARSVLDLAGLAALASALKRFE